MADTKITDLDVITGAGTATGDVFTLVDVSDTTMDASGTNKQITRAELVAIVETLVSIAGSQITSGTVADARIASTIARDTEVVTAVAAEATARDAAIAVAIAALIDSSPGALDTLNELAAAINDDASFAATVTTALGGKQTLDATLTALAAYNTNGLLTQTAADTFAGRTITAGSAKVTVTNGNGVSGNPTVDLGAVAITDITDLDDYITNLLSESAQRAVIEQIRDLADLNQFVATGLAPTVSGTAGRIDLSVGTVFNIGVEVNVAAQTAIAASQVATLGAALTAGQSMWVLVEVEPAGTIAFNSGAGAIEPEFPTPTAANVPVAAMWIPEGATTINTDLTGTPTVAKLIDVRVLKPGPLPSGWIHDQHTWEYVSTTSILINDVDARVYLAKGTKISYNDGSGAEYGVVASVSYSAPDTTITLIPNSDYAVANASLVRPRYSLEEAPSGFPGWFTWAPTVTGWAATTTVYRWRPMGGNSLMVSIRQQTAGASSSATHTISAPITAATIAGMVWGTTCRATDNGTVQMGGVQLASAGSNITCFGILTSATNTGSGNANIFLAQFVYEF